ncbi:GvpL/GvpF family gas vesicle protein [Nocardioides sp. IC4_145]|uniref:GvpL/GvpF family gas vesicle protein n=1 Tax=Nocardioides sp. IC4_145 TaxID=2714037 RepID=UPI00140B280F|nr:GvpL/GvpF family gas vesicle protein [Nocardioides sp. IC4_145]
MSTSARYVYAISRGLRPGPLEVRGIHGAEVEVVRHLDLDAVVSDVDLAEFGEEPLRENLEQLSWLEDVVRDHDRVVQAVAQVGPTAPLRLATVFLDDDGMRARLFEWRFALEQVLDRVTGRHEWSVKVVLPPAPAPAGVGPGAATHAGDAQAAAGGADYLRRKKESLAGRVAAEERGAELGRAVHQALAGRAAASRLLPPQDPRLSGHTGTMVHNGAYLVADDEHEAFVERLRELTAQHPDVVVDVGGPWPPYSFAMLEQR